MRARPFSTQAPRPVVLACLAGFGILAIAACAPQPGAPALSLAALPPEETVQTGFGEFSRAGQADNLPDWRRTEVSTATGGKPVPAIFSDITAITVEPQTLPTRLSPGGQGSLQVAIGYWNARGLRQSWERGPVTVSYQLFASDDSRGTSATGAQITSGDAVLAVPGSTFRVQYPLPEQRDPPSYGILQGSVRLPNGTAFPFRQTVVRRSRWVPGPSS